jgi:hypothetical protein
VRPGRETRVERWLRLWHLHRGDVKKSLVAAVLIAIGFVSLWIMRSGLRTLFHQVETSGWWSSISPPVRDCLGGLIVGVSGVFLLRRRWRRRGRLSSFLDVRVFVAEGAMVIAGAALVLKGLGVI